MNLRNGWSRDYEKEIVEMIKGCGFITMHKDEKRMSFNLGYTEDGFSDEVYHLHLHYFWDNDELYFRDYLNEFPLIAKKYTVMAKNLYNGKYE